MRRGETDLYIDPLSAKKVAQFFVMLSMDNPHIS
jgi:hypothetical protein